MSGGSNAQKVPLARALNQVAGHRFVDLAQLEGKQLPCSIVSTDGWIVTVKFEIETQDFTLPQITIPVFSSNYDYLPLQEGDKGLCMTADTYLGGISGLGGGTAQLSLLPNLTTLGFVPCGNTDFTPPADPLMRVVQGPNGVIVQTLDGALSIKLDKNSGKIEVTGELWINGHKYLNHEHSGVQSGSSNSGGVHDP